MARKPTTYWDYIRVEEILALQDGLPDDDGDLANERGHVHHGPPDR